MCTDLPGLLPMRNPIQPYAWGSTEAIARLQGRDPGVIPEAEMWMGAHPRAPSEVLLNGDWRRLDELIAKQGESLLGPEVNQRWRGRLPFLLKILAAAQPLSVQVHPDLDQARRGFDRENIAHIPLDAAGRNYRDPMHKPELLYALGPFWVMAGLRGFDASRNLIADLAAPKLHAHFSQAAKQPQDQRMLALWRSLLTLDRTQQKHAVDDIRQCMEHSSLVPEIRHWVQELAARYPDDIGVVMPLLLNVFELQAGEAVALSAGVPHAYLQGLGVELMASSDNVLRGGLTPKHVDVEELLSVMSFAASDEPRLPAVIQDGATVFDSGADEFVLRLLRVNPDSPRLLQPGPAQILLATSGQLDLSSGEDGTGFKLCAGQSVFCRAGRGVIEASGEGELICASLPDHTPA